MPLTPRFSCGRCCRRAFAVSGAIFGVFTTSGCGSRGNGDLRQRAGFRGRLDEVGDAAMRAIDAAFHAAVEQEVGVAVGQRFPAPVGRRLRRDGGRRRRARRGRALRVARPVDAEHRLLLLEQLDHRVQPLTRLRLAGDAEQH